MSLRPISAAALTSAMLLTLPATSAAYTIVFLDDSTLVTLEKYQTVGNKAFVTLPSGTQTEFPLVEINLEKTREINRIGVRRGLLIDRRDTKILVSATRANVTTMADLVREHRFGTLRSNNNEAAARMRLTHAGNLDLFAVDHTKSSRRGSADALRANMKDLDMIRFRVADGTTESRLLLDFTTNTNSEVYRAITASAEALLATREQDHDLKALELIMATSTRLRAAQFVLTASSARALVDQKISPGDFFVQNVQF